MSVQGNDNLKIITEDASEAFYFRYYSGHQGKFGHEFLEFDIKVDTSKETGLLRYVNSSNYRRDELIRKQVTISPTVVTQLKRMIKDSEIIKEDDSKWPEKNRDGKQELEIKMGKIHIGFEVSISFITTIFAKMFVLEVNHYVHMTNKNDRLAKSRH